MHFDAAFFLQFVFQPRAALLYGLLTAVLTTIAAMILGSALGVLLAICGTTSFRSARWFNNAYVFIFRGTPLLVQVIIIYFGLPYLIKADLFPQRIGLLGLATIPGAILAGVVAFALHEAAYFSEIARAAIGSVDSGQWDASRALGMTPGLLMRRIILPQSIRTMLPPLGNQVNSMLKSTSLLYLIAVPEVMFVADAVNSATYKSFEIYLGISVYYLAMTTAWSAVQHRLEVRYSRGFGLR